MEGELTTEDTEITERKTAGWLCQAALRERWGILLFWRVAQSDGFDLLDEDF